ncbi:MULTISPECIES: heavy metal translocating P-type ATPase [Sphingobacterium]|uniref:P-type Zn(2+) transporter n=1 Tax=Sphingobacterium populi TaxID=1812824 RepID=A0ABW5UDK2_9SPHI|nr:heavy metal translocating P-type ATPase [Sphingobacterium sp. CFCC 11742]
MKHRHTYNDKGEAICCGHNDELVTNTQTNALLSTESLAANWSKKNQYTYPNDTRNHHHTGDSSWTLFLEPTFAIILLLLAIAFDNNWIKTAWFGEINRIIWYAGAYLIVGVPVLKNAIRAVSKAKICSESFLVTIATMGVFYLGNYAEGVAVMVLYTIGTIFHSSATSRAKSNIKAISDQQPTQVTIVEHDKLKNTQVNLVQIDDIIQLKQGEKLELDGQLLSDQAAFNTAALTGKSKSDIKTKGDRVLAGMINTDKMALVRVTRAYKNNKRDKIVKLAQDNNLQKTPTETFIRKWAKVYTLITVSLAMTIIIVPYLMAGNYEFETWLYRALVFLVISCPYVFIIFIPLGYYSSIVAASRIGIYFRGSHFLDLVANVKHIALDKTGILTEGIFKVRKVNFNTEFDRMHMLQLVNAIESISKHPVAKAIHEYVGTVDPTITLENVQEIPGYGLRAIVDSKELLVGNFKLLKKFEVAHQIEVSSKLLTLIAVAYGGRFVGYITIADSLKETAAHSIHQLEQLNVRCTMLSSDRECVIQHIAKQLKIPYACGNLLQQEKIKKVNQLKAKKELVAFVSNGDNDAEVAASSDVHIAMGGLESDNATERSDVIIQGDNPLKIIAAIRIGQQTKQIIWQNITIALFVKMIVLMLAVCGLANMWEAIFVDIGISLIAIMNAIRILRVNYDVQ